MPDRQADDLYRWQRFPAALDTVVDTVSIASHQPAPIVPIDFVVVAAAADMSPSMDGFVPYSKKSVRILGIGWARMCRMSHSEWATGLDLFISYLKIVLALTVFSFGFCMLVWWSHSISPNKMSIITHFPFDGRKSNRSEINFENFIRFSIVAHILANFHNEDIEFKSNFNQQTYSEWVKITLPAMELNLS